MGVLELSTSDRPTIANIKIFAPIGGTRDWHRYRPPTGCREIAMGRPQ
jgi:hypothetical protein